MGRRERALERLRRLPGAAADGTRRCLRGLPDVLTALGFEQRVAGAAALLLIVSTFGAFSWTEAAVVLVAVAVLLLLHQRGAGRAFHLPLGDGAAIAAAGAWTAVLIASRLLDRPVGQGLLALACAALLVLTGSREHARRPADDLPEPEPRAQPTASAGRGPGPM